MSASIPIIGPLKGARVVARPNRFTLRVALEPEETEVLAHLEHPDTLPDLLQADRRVWVRATPDDGRRTEWSAALVQADGGALVSLQPTLATELVQAALEAECIDELDGWFVERTEAPLGRSRVEFQLSTYAGDKMLLAVQAVTRVRGGVARYPDSAQEQHRRRLLDLIDITNRPGWHASVIFVVQRNDVQAVAPDEGIDPQFADALRAAESSGVRLIGRRCQLTLEETMLGLPIPVDLWDVPIRTG